MAERLVRIRVGCRPGTIDRIQAVADRFDVSETYVSGIALAIGLLMLEQVANSGKRSQEAQVATVEKMGADLVEGMQSLVRQQQ